MKLWDLGIPMNTNILNEVQIMYGMLINEQEKEEIVYLLKREMDEIIYDLKDEHIEHIVKNAMEERYKTLFSLFKRLAAHRECMKYILPAGGIGRKK